MISLQSAELMAARRYFGPVPELLVLAGEESAERLRRRLVPAVARYSGLASAQLRIVDITTAWYWQQSIDCGSHGPDGVLRVMQRLQRSEVTKSIAQALCDCVELVGDSPFAGVPILAWAEYLSSAALARLLLLVGSGHLQASDETVRLPSIQRLARARITTVTAPFWLAADSDPIMGIAGWVAPSKPDPQLLVSAMVLSQDDAINGLRWNALCELDRVGLPHWQECLRMRTPYQVEATC